jgi:hypothetical protein
MNSKLLRTHINNSQQTKPETIGVRVEKFIKNYIEKYPKKHYSKKEFISIVQKEFNVKDTKYITEAVNNMIKDSILIKDYDPNMTDFRTAWYECNFQYV